MNEPTKLPLTTAESVGRLRRELLAEKLPEALIDDLVRAALVRMIDEDGVIVHATEGE